MSVNRWEKGKGFVLDDSEIYDGYYFEDESDDAKDVKDANMNKEGESNEYGNDAQN